MPIANQVNAKDYYSYKDWGQKLFNVTNAALDTASMFKGNIQGMMNGGSGAAGMMGGGGNGTGMMGGFGNIKQNAQNLFSKTPYGANNGAGANTFPNGGALGSFNFSGGLGSWGQFTPNTGFNIKPKTAALQNSGLFNTNYANMAGIGYFGGQNNFNAGFNNAGLNSTNSVIAGNNSPGAANGTTSPGGQTGNGTSNNNSSGSVMPDFSQAYKMGEQTEDDDGSAKYKMSAAMEGLNGMTQGAMSGSIGTHVNARNQAIVNIIGNQYRDSGQRIAYGNSTYSAPSRKDLERKTRQYTNALGNEAFYSNANNFDDLANEVNQRGLYHKVSSDLTTKQKGLGIFQRALNNSGKGAQLGEKIGGLAGNNPFTKTMGAIIGGAAGLVAGTFGGIFGARRGRERLRKIQAAQNYANMSRDQQVQDSVSNMNQRNMNQFYAQSLSRGGLIESVLHRNRYAHGGRMDSGIPTWMSDYLNRKSL